MASSAKRGAARARGASPPRPPAPPPQPAEEVTAFYALVERVATAASLGREACCAELCDRAAKQAQRLYGDNSLVVAELRVGEARALRNLACTSTSSSEHLALRRRAWAILAPVHAVLLRRLADNTLLPGTNTDAETTYGARAVAFTLKAQDKPVPSEAALHSLGAVLGYETMLDAVSNTLALLNELRGSGLPRESAQSFVLMALDAIPRAATRMVRLEAETALASIIEQHCSHSTTSLPSVMLCFANGAQVPWPTCCAHVSCCRPQLHHISTTTLRSKPANVLTLQTSGCASAHGRPATRWSAPSASSSSAPAVAPCGTAARSITCCTGGHTKRIVKSWTRRDGRRWLPAGKHLALLDELDARRTLLKSRRATTRGVVPRPAY